VTAAPLRHVARDVYLDTSVLLAAVMDGVPHHKSALRFCQELTRERAGVYFSQLLRIECIHAIRAVGTNPKLVSEMTRRRYRLAHWGDDLGVRQRWMADGIARVEELLSEFDRVFEAPHDLNIWLLSVEIMCRYQIKSYDATHVATAIHLGIADFASVDGDFMRVDALNVTLIRDAATA
jgi:predicted nucleic acid-binding protein